MMAARASSMVRSAVRPDSTASRSRSGSSAMTSPTWSATGGRSRLAHKMLAATPASSTAMSRAYASRVTGKCGADPDPDRGRRVEGMAVGRCPAGGGLRPWPDTCRLRPNSTSTAAPRAPAPSTVMSTPRSLTAVASWLPRLRRRSRITNRITITTPSATPTTGASWCSGPSRRGLPTAPRSPASPATISSTSGSSRTSQSCAVSADSAERLPQALAAFTRRHNFRLAAGHRLTFLV